MSTPEIIALALVLLISFCAVLYIVRAKRKGKKCIGCPYADACAKGCTCGKNDTQGK